MRTQINHTLALENGIIIYSNSNEDYAAIATIDKVGNIKAEWSSIQKYRKEHKRDRILEVLKIIFFILPFLVILLALYVILLLRATFTVAYFRVFLQFFLLCYLIFILLSLLYVTKTSKKFYSASCMLINAYKDLGMAPSLEELRKYSNITISDGKIPGIIKAIKTLLLLFCTFINNPFVAIIAILIVSILFKLKLEVLLHYYIFLNYPYVFYVASPTDTELMVAISAINVWIENEGYK